MFLQLAFSGRSVISPSDSTWMTASEAKVDLKERYG
jgi:hypothetical protein